MNMVFGSTHGDPFYLSVAVQPGLWTNSRGWWGALQKIYSIIMFFKSDTHIYKGRKMFYERVQPRDTAGIYRSSGT